jgi:rubrerythrin
VKDNGEKEVFPMNLNMFEGKNDGDQTKLEDILANAIEIEENLMRTYLIAAERVHSDDELKERLENFAQGNAKRTKQLLDELSERKEK